MDNLAKANFDLKLKVYFLDDKIVKIEAEKTKLQGANETLLSKLDTANSKLASERDHNEQRTKGRVCFLDDKVEKLLAEKSKLQEVNKTLLSKLETANSNLAAEIDKNEQKTKETSRLFHNKVEGLSAEKSKLQESNKMLLSNLNVANSNLAAELDKNEQKTKEVESMISVVEEATAMIAFLEEQLEKVHSAAAATAATENTSSSSASRANNTNPTTSETKTSPHQSAIYAEVNTSTTTSPSSDQRNNNTKDKGTGTSQSPYLQFHGKHPADLNAATQPRAGTRHPDDGKRISKTPTPTPDTSETTSTSSFPRGGQRTSAIPLASAHPTSKLARSNTLQPNITAPKSKTKPTIQENTSSSRMSRATSVRHTEKEILDHISKSKQKSSRPLTLGGPIFEDQALLPVGCGLRHKGKISLRKD